MLIDARKAAALHENGNKEALTLSRVSFMGTDGMRGKVTIAHMSETENCFEALLYHGLLTPEIVSLAAFAFTRILIEKGILRPGDTVCVGNDGRDAATGWCLDRAMKEGFVKCGIAVEDAGIVPTPFVPLHAATHGFRVGAMLTASHNPSNQNGIKFFLDGKKLLSEGPIGDYAISARMFLLREEMRACVPCAQVTTVDTEAEDLTFLRDAVPAEGLSWIRERRIFLDTANGAYSMLAGKYLASEKIPFTSVNEKPDGFNINRGCGVAEIEGASVFDGNSDGSASPIVAAMLADAGCGRDSFGIVLDGDGDRGFILYCVASENRVYVLDGDICGFLVSEYLAKRNPAVGKLAVFTVESDPMAVSAVTDCTGLKTDIVDVGDKWICNYPEDDMLVGMEASGHLVLPVTVRHPSGQTVLRAGNGLLTALVTLTAISTRDRAGRPFYRPYESGFSVTFYTYFVDKSRFAAGSPLLENDRKILKEEIEKIEGFSFSEKKMQDRNMLYLSLFKDGEPIASIFTRNSGTEDKNAVYLKCRKEIKDLLLPVAERIRDIHREILRDRDNPDYQCAERIIALLETHGALSSNSLEQMLPGMPVHAVLHALSREKRVVTIHDKWRIDEP